MKHVNDYRKYFLEFKKELKKTHVQDNIYNYVLLKIRKEKYNNIDKYIDYMNIELFAFYILLKFYDKKSIRIKKYNKKKEYYIKSIYKEKLKILNINIEKSLLKKAFKKINLRDINIFKYYYNSFINLFIDIDKHFTKDILEKLTSLNYIGEYRGLDNLIGLGLFIRNEYILPKNNQDIIKIFSNSDEYNHDDSKSNLILKGYKCYKIGMFNIFEEKGHCA
jgi:hypothetical protein